jgi:hypothetical protein
LKQKTEVTHIGQKFVDRPVYKIESPRRDLISEAVVAAMANRANPMMMGHPGAEAGAPRALPISILTHYERTRLQWMTRAADGTLVAKAKR